MNNSKSIQVNTAMFILISPAACLIYAISSGVRANYGVIIGAIVDNSGVEYDKVSFVMAVGQLMVGIVQPLFGALALRKSNSVVLSIGALMMALGMVGISLSHSLFALLIFLGIILSGGTGALAFGIVMGAITPAIGEKRAAAVSGMVSASAGLGSIIFAPAMQQLIAHIGLKGMFYILCIPVGVLIPITIWLGRKEIVADGESPEDAKEAGFFETLKSAIKDKSYVFIALAFFTCGFHMSIIETHLYSQYVSYGFADAMVAFAFSVYGIAAMLGCIFTGFLSARFPNRFVLGGTYASRILIVLSLLVLPKSTALLYITAFLFGFTGNATVPPTSGLITKLHGAKRLGMLFGIAFLSHQIGAFFSSWLGGICVAVTGSYVLIWSVSMTFSLGAAILAISVKEPKTKEE